MTCWSSHKYIREGLNFVEGFVHLATLTLFRQRRGGFRASTDLLSSIISKPLSYESNISHSKIFWFFFPLLFVTRTSTVLLPLQADFENHV